MEFFKNNILTIITFLPVVGAVWLILHERIWGKSDESLRRLALIFSLATFILSLPLAFWFDGGTSAMQFEKNVPWIDAFNLKINYHVGVDGLSLWLVMLTTFLMPITILSTWSAIETRVREFMAFMLLLETGVIGVFVALDLFLFYLFWEVMLVPMYFLIGVWGGERRIYAAVKFVIYTMAGSLLMLAAIIALAYLTNTGGPVTFDIVQITNAITGGNRLAFEAQMWLFAAFGLAFMIKVPLFPFHTWLPDAHVEAPTAGSVILAAVLLKMGTYGLLRFNLPMFPDAARAFAPYILVLAVIGIIYGALVAMVQPDLKKLIAYSSVSHLGFVVLGTFAFTQEGIQGAIYQMLNHGISTGALFLIVGVIYERRHTRMIAEFGGLASSMPVFSAVFMIITLSSIGLPLLNGFIGEFLILLGTFTSTFIARPRLFGALATTGIIWSAAYMLWMFQRVILGEAKNPNNKTLPDLNLREKIVLIPLVAMTIIMGVYPSLFLNKTERTAQQVQRVVTANVVQRSTFYVRR